MEYKAVEGFATKEDLKDMIDCLKKAMPPPVFIEVHEDKTPVLIIMEPDSPPMNNSVLCFLHQKFGEDVIILDHKQAVEQGIRRNLVFDPEPIIIKANPVMDRTLIAPRRDDNKPWYDRFKKKRGKKR